IAADSAVIRRPVAGAELGYTSDWRPVGFPRLHQATQISQQVLLLVGGGVQRRHLRPRSFGDLRDLGARQQVQPPLAILKLEVEVAAIARDAAQRRAVSKPY